MHGKELWRSDGTTEGTVLVKDILTGGPSSTPDQLAAVDGTLFLTATDDTHGRELWKSDGTTDGTVLVKDIASNAYYPNSSEIQHLTDVGGTLFFSAVDDDHGRELWRSDGTEAGTVMVKDIRLGSYHGYWFGSNPDELTPVGDTLFFAAFRDDVGTELWRSDGTADGTVMVADINPGSVGYSPRSSYPQDLTAIGDTVYFVADDGVHGSELWRSDGSAHGTDLVRSIDPRDVPSPRVDELTAVGDRLYLAADDGVHGRELWVSDGTSGGTRLVVDLAPGETGSRVSDLTVSTGRLFFTGAIGAPGPDLWRVVTGPHGPTCAGVIATMPGAGRIHGTPAADVIVGSRRGDRIVAGGGDDIVCGAAGDDTLVGRSGGDVLRGGRGDDDLVLRDRIRGNDLGDGGRGKDSARKDRGDQLSHVP